MAEACVVLFDVDNTLFDNDGFTEDLQRHLAQNFGTAEAQRYRACFEALRDELELADYLGALQRFRREAPPALRSDPRLLQVAAFMLDYPFARRLYSGALAAVQRMRAVGPTVILSDGDVVFQPHKIRRAGLWDAVEGRVRVYVHKERMLGALQRSFPARHYLMVDDKPRVLAAMKAVLGDRLTTCFVRQGHYALDPDAVARYPAPDLALARIDALLELDLNRALDQGEAMHPDAGPGRDLPAPPGGRQGHAPADLRPAPFPEGNEP